MERINDTIRLCGELAGRPVISHRTGEGAFYKFPLSVRRLSGTEDVLNVLASERLVEELHINGLPRIAVRGEVRSWNNRTGVGPKLVISVFARELAMSDADYENAVALTGAICREPVLRRTPMGREICDIMLAVNRAFGRSDYIPTIAWGATARAAAGLPVGTEIEITGRLQSRGYIKLENGAPIEKTAFEVSVLTLENSSVESYIPVDKRDTAADCLL